jgi:hypothetical protein
LRCWAFCSCFRYRCRLIRRADQRKRYPPSCCGTIFVRRSRQPLRFRNCGRCTCE